MREPLNHHHRKHKILMIIYNISHIKQRFDNDEFEQDKQRQRPRIASWRMFLYSFAALISAMSMGIVIGWNSAALNSMQQSSSVLRIDTHEPLDNYYMTWIGSCIALGAFVGSLASGPITDCLGRKFTLIILAFPFTIGWIMINLAQSFLTIIMGRFTTGVCAGIISNVVPGYVADIVTPNTRGFLGTCFQLLCSFGVLFTACLGTFLKWNELAMVAIVPVIISSAGMCFATESPVRLIQKDNNSKAALQALEILRSNQSDIDDELVELEKRIKMNQQIVDAANESSNGLFSLLKRPDIYCPFIIVVMLQFFQQFSGINAIMFYLVSIFNDSGLSMDSHLASILVDSALTFSCLFSGIFMDKFGRRIWLLISGAGMFITMATMAFYYTNFNNQQNWTPLICLIIFSIAFACGFGPIPWMIVGEITPPEATGLVGSFAAGTNWLCAFVITKEFEDLIYYIGKEGAYAMFSIFSLLSIFFVIFFVPETKQKSVEDIQRHFLEK